MSVVLVVGVMGLRLSKLGGGAKEKGGGEGREEEKEGGAGVKN